MEAPAPLKKDKFKNLILYICSKCALQDLGSVKLNKTLWYSDIVAYQKLGEEITNEVYKKQKLGPVSYHILPIITELEEEGKLVCRNNDFFGYEKQEYITLTKPNLKLFSADEISIVDSMIDFCCIDHSAVGISRVSHDSIWEMAEIGEEIPPNAVYASRLGDIDEDDMKWADKVLKASA
jgi:hypothetical protein